MDVIEARRRILLNAPHIVTPTSAGLVNFSTDMKAPLKECKVHFTPVQEGTGDPSPENVRPISGWTGVEVYRGYEYLSNVEITIGKTLKASGLEATESGMAVTDYIPVEVGHTYTLKFTSTTAERTRRILGYSALKEPTSQLASVSWAAVGNTFSMNAEIPSDTSYIRACYYNGDIGKTLTEPSAVTALPIDWTDSAGTVYGGYVDLVSGEVVKTWAVINEIYNLNGYISGSQYRGTYYTDIWFDTRDIGFSVNGSYIAFDESRGKSNMLTPIASPIWSEPDNYPWHFVFNSWNQLHIVFENAALGITSETSHAECINLAKTWLRENPIEVVFLVREANYTRYSISPSIIKTICGINNLWSNASGNIDLSYWTH